MLRVLLATAMPPPEHGGIINWTRVVRRELGQREDIELFFVDTSRRYKGIRGFPELSRILFGSCQALGVIYRLFRSLRAHRPHVLHLNTSGSYGVARDLIILYMARILKVPVVAHFHMQKSPAEVNRKTVYWKLLLRAMSLAGAVVVLDKRSEAVVRAALPRQKISILPTMVEIDVIDELCARRCDRPCVSGSPAKIVFVGFVIPVKGVRELVKACVQLQDDNQDMELDMLGRVPDPSLQTELERLAEASGKGGWLHFHGGVDHAEVLERILAADLLVLPSHAESAPAVIIEAMGCSKPVVSTTTGAIPEMLDIGGPEECGICVPPRDVNALADAIRRLIADPSLRQEFGCKGRCRAEQHYSVPVGCRQLSDVWRSVAKPAMD